MRKEFSSIMIFKNDDDNAKHWMRNVSYFLFDLRSLKRKREKREEFAWFFFNVYFARTDYVVKFQTCRLKKCGSIPVTSWFDGR